MLEKTQFENGDRVRLKSAGPGTAWVGTVIDPVPNRSSFLGRRWAVRWDGSGVTVPGYRFDELERDW